MSASPYYGYEAAMVEPSLNGMAAWGGSSSEAFTDYCQLRSNCCYSYKQNLDFGTMIQTYSKELNARTGKQVLAGAVAGNAADRLEAGLRLWSGCTLEKNEDSAMAWWMQIAFETSPETNAPIPRGIRVRALSCLANSQWELKVTEDDPDTWNIDSVHRAGVFADDCAALGFVSAIMLHIGMKIRELRALPHVPEARHPRFTKLEYLWEIVETRNQEMAREKQKRDQTVVKAPNAYVCALKGCGIEGTRKSALLRCAGKCPADVKPSYCSKECQKADWKKHKLICKPNAAAKDKPHVADAPAAKTKMTIGESIRTDGKEVRIEMPDIIGGSGTIPLVSKTMTPEFMKDVRDEVEKLLVTDADKRSEAN